MIWGNAMLLMVLSNLIWDSGWYISYLELLKQNTIGKGMSTEMHLPKSMKAGFAQPVTAGFISPETVSLQIATF